MKKFRIIAITCLAVLTAASLSGCFIRVGSGTEEEYFREKYGNTESEDEDKEAKKDKDKDKDKSEDKEDDENEGMDGLLNPDKKDEDKPEETEEPSVVKDPSDMSDEELEKWTEVLTNVPIEVKTVRYSGDMTVIELSAQNNLDTDVYFKNIGFKLNDSEDIMDEVSAYVKLDKNSSADCTIYVDRKLVPGDELVWSFEIQGLPEYNQLAQGHYTFNIYGNQ